MLILTRKKDESIMIGDVEVKITSISKDIVKIGINASKEVLIYRKEIYDEIHSQNIAAASVAVDDLDVFARLVDS